MKLLAIYTVFNGCELLAPSLKIMRKFVDEVLIVKQQVSNRGQQMKPEDFEALINLDASIISFDPILSIGTKDNERRKLQLAIDWAKRRKFTHFILLATDHFYRPVEIAKAIELYKQNPVDVTATKMYTYYKYPTWRLTPIENYVMPFICRIYPETIVTKSNNYPWTVDPSVRITPATTFRLFEQNEIMLHHFSMVRKDISNKFSNAAASVNWKEKIPAFIDEYNNYDIKENPGVSYFGGRKIEVVKDEFGIKKRSLYHPIPTR